MQIAGLRSSANNSNTLNNNCGSSGGSFATSQYYDDRYDEGDRAGQVSYSLEATRVLLSSQEQVQEAPKVHEYYQVNGMDGVATIDSTANGGDRFHLQSADCHLSHHHDHQNQEQQQENHKHQQDQTMRQYCYILNTTDTSHQDSNNNDECNKHQPITREVSDPQQQQQLVGLYTINDPSQANLQVQEALLELDQRQHEHQNELQTTAPISHTESIRPPLVDASSGVHIQAQYYNQQQQALDHELNLSHHHLDHYVATTNGTPYDKANPVCGQQQTNSRPEIAYVPLTYVPFSGHPSGSQTSSSMVFQESVLQQQQQQQPQIDELEGSSLAYDQHHHQVLVDKPEIDQLPAYMTAAGQQALPTTSSCIPNSPNTGSMGHQMFTQNQELSYHSLELASQYEARGDDCQYHQLIGGLEGVDRGNHSTKENCHSNSTEYFNNESHQFQYASYQQLETSRRHYYDQNQDHHHYNQLQQSSQSIPTGSQESYSSALSTYSATCSHSSSSSSSNCDASETESFASQLTRDEKKAREANIPLSYYEIVNLSIDQFNEQITKHGFTEAQLTLMKDIRRRGKNKVAAQTCRKRKMEQIIILQHEVNQLKVKRRSLCQERSQLVEQHTRLITEYDRVYSIIKQRMQPQLQQLQHL